MYNRAMKEWRWIRWYPVAHQSAEHYLQGLEESAAKELRPDLPLKALIVLTARKGVELTSDQLQRVAACLARERLKYSTWDGLGTYGAGFATSDDELHASQLFYRRLLQDAGPRAVEAMRWLLTQPPLGAGPCMPLPGMGLKSTIARGARIPHAAAWPLRGAKLIAVEILSEHGDESDLPRYLAVCGDGKEDRWTRAVAGLAALRLGGEAVAEEVAQGCVEPILPGAGGVGWLAPYAEWLAPGGELLVNYIVKHLSDLEPDHRHGAAAMLKAIGKPAVPALVQMIEAEVDLDAMEQAAVVLAVIAPAEFRRLTSRLEGARRRYEIESRGLSRAAAPGADAERGLSRGER